MIRREGKVLFVLLDAFRHDYINPVDTPFLYAGTRRGVYAKKLKSTTGFTQRAAIFTGSMGSESGMFTMYTFDPEASPFRFLKNDGRAKRMVAARNLLDKIPMLNGLRRVKRLLTESQDQQQQGYRRHIQNQAKEYASHAPPAYIPLTLLPFIGVSEDNRPIHLPGAFAEESIFDVFVQEQIDYNYLMFPAFNCDDEAVMELILGAGQSSARVVLGQFSDSDLLVHHCGPTSQKRRAIAGEIDRRLRDLALHYDEDATWVIIGDHGMTDVTEELDVSSELAALEKEAGIRRGVDYLVFLDSTMARFRWLTERGKHFSRKYRRNQSSTLKERSSTNTWLGNITYRYLTVAMGI